jgi:two-component system phosphate regulon sensor histidine kinase PhoR
MAPPHFPIILAGLKVKYDFNKTKDTLMARDKNPTGMYTDLASGAHYSVKVKNAGITALKSIWLELTLSILLLSSLAIAFYTMSRTIAQERALLTAKNDFIQNMTHELKTPIATVKVALEGLHEFDGMNDIDKRDEYLKISQYELDRLSLLVDRVLSLSKLDKELPPAVKEKIDLKDLVSQIADTFKVQALKQNAVINVHPSNANIYLTADKQWISGIIYNLIENAIKYADKDHTQIDLYLNKITNSEAGLHLPGDIEIKIKDNGPGIAHEYQSKIFEKFYRIPHGNVHTIKGHGLGLAFVKKLVEEMGGKISLLSDPGKGSEFSITLPA